MFFGPEQAGRSKRRRAMVPFEAGDSVAAKVVLAKPDAKWAVASTADGRLLVVQVTHALSFMEWFGRCFGMTGMPVPTIPHAGTHTSSLALHVLVSTVSIVNCFTL